MKLLVTGGAGYIGSVVANQLLERGHEVAVLDDLSRGHRGAIPDGARHLEVGLADAEGTKDALAEGFDGVLHFAALALVAESVEFPERYHRGNFVGTLNLLDAMREHDVKRLVFSSTCATYGEPEVVPMPETLPTNPVNSYGNSKLAVDRMIGDECRAHGLGAISLRYFNVAGASGPYGEDHYPETHLIPLVLQAAAGTREHVSVFGTDYPTEDGTAVRDYIHVEDLGRAHLLAMDALQHGHAHDLQPRQRPRLLRAPGDRGRPQGHGPRHPRQGGAAPPRRSRAARRLQREDPHRARVGAREGPRDDDRRRVGVAPGAPRRLRQGGQRGLKQRLGRLRRVEHDPPLRLGGGQLVVGAGACGPERLALALDAIFRLAAPAHALQRELRVDAQEQRPVGREPAGARTR